MKNLINWKLFFILLLASIFTTLMVLPYTIALSPILTKAFSPLLLLGSVIQGTVLFSIFIFLGLLLAKRIGFGLPILEGILKKENQTKNLKSILGISIGMGLIGSFAIILLSFLWPDLSITFLKAEMSVPTWKGFLAAFYGGIGEEIFARLFLMTLFVWIATKIKKLPGGRPIKLAFG